MKQLIILIEEKLKRKLFVKLAMQGKTAKEVLTALIEKWVKK